MALLVIAEDRQRLDCGLADTQLSVLAADSVNEDYNLVNLQFNVFKTSSTGGRCMCIALFLKNP